MYLYKNKYDIYHLFYHHTHLKIVLHTTSNIKSCRIKNNTVQVTYVKGCILATTVRFVPFKD